MKLQCNSRARRQSGYSALFITLILVAASVLLLGATLSRTSSGTRLNDRNCQYISSEGAAEAAVEKVMARMMVDFANSGEGLVQSNLTLYRTGLLPTTNDDTYWGNFNFSDGTGNTNAVYVARTTTNANAPYVALAEQYSGLSGYASTYRIMANVTLASSTFNYGFTNAVQQDVQLAQIPVFQFAIFYNGVMEFSDCATMTVNNGPVHCNTNILTGSPSALTFNSMVTASGNITSPANAGFSTGSWTGAVTYNGTPSPGFLTGKPTLTLPIGTNSTQGSNVIQILYPSNNTQNAAMVSQLYTTKAHMVLMISNTTFTATFKSAANDAAPQTFTMPLSMLQSNSWLNNQSINTSNNWGTNWGWNWNWLSVTNTFYDFRETAQVQLTQIDVGKLTNWMATWLTAAHNTNISGKYNANNPFNIIYVADWRFTNSTAGGASTISAIRLVDGTNLPSTGLTFATPDPMYIQSIYNCPVAAYQGTTNTTASPPASVACDSITLLSPNWNDANAVNSGSSPMPGAKSDTVNCAILAGNVATTGTGSTQYSGGANNLTRLLEDWSSSTLTLNTSLVCLYNSQWATTQFQLPGVYYKAPTRNFNFNLAYTASTGMPPGTPNICRLIRSAWCNPTPGDTNFNYSFANDFVPQ
jgi:hypothetical protein